MKKALVVAGVGVLIAGGVVAVVWYVRRRARQAGALGLSTARSVSPAPMVSGPQAQLGYGAQVVNTSATLRQAAAVQQGQVPTATVGGNIISGAAAAGPRGSRTIEVVAPRM